MIHAETRQIETERLILRRFQPEDWADLYEYLSQPETVRFEPYEPFTEEAVRQEAVNRAANADFWAVVRKSDQKLIGNLYFSKQEFDSWKLGYVFNQHHWHCGYAAEACKALMNHAFTVMNVRRVTAMCNPINESSWRLLERIGFIREGHLRKNIYFKKDADGNPIWLDTFIYGLFEDEWRIDFDSAMAEMNAGQRGWLQAALKTMNPSGHQWLEENVSCNKEGFWSAIDTLVAQSEILIDRPKGTKHPRFDFIYPLDYGYLKDTTSPDGGGIDVWRGSLSESVCDAVICTVDLFKKDSEIKILIGCTEEEKTAILRFHNDSEYMKGTMIRREGEV